MVCYKDETADIDSIGEKLDSQDKADKIHRKKSIGCNLLYDSLEGYKFPAFYKYNDRNELHEKKKTSRFSKSIHEIEGTILKLGENYIEMKQKKKNQCLIKKKIRNLNKYNIFGKMKYCVLFI